MADHSDKRAGRGVLQRKSSSAGKVGSKGVYGAMMAVGLDLHFVYRVRRVCVCGGLSSLHL